MSPNLPLLKHACLSCLMLSLSLTQLALQAAEPTEPTVVTKLVCDFDKADWQGSQWSKASSTVFAEANEAAPGGQGGYLRADIRFSGEDFQWQTLEPSEAIVIPGKARSISLWVKGGDDYPMIMAFRDGWGNDKKEGEKLEWVIQRNAKQWQKVSFDVPQHWIFPISIAGITTHNHSKKDVKRQVAFYYDDLSVSTDVADVDTQTGALKGWQPHPEKPDFKQPLAKLFSANITSQQMSHVFSASKPAFALATQIWSSAAAAGELHYTVIDWQGQIVDEQKLPLSTGEETPFAPRLSLFGRYVLSVDVSFAGVSKMKETIKFAYLPATQTLSEAEQQASPYGLNVHGGRLVRPSVFVQAGIQWYRDYAFSYAWTKKSQGADHSYTAWPNHRAIVDAYTKAKVKYLACVMKFIPRPAKDQKPGSMPKQSAEYVAHLKEVCTAFPEIKYWEVDNEYDLHLESEHYEKSVNWQHYHDYHAAFADAVAEATNGQAVTVENGRAGIWPQLVKNAIDSGAFDKVGVINSHHYTGTDAPESNVGNHNTSFGDAFSGHQQPELFYDHLREVSRIADSDGIDREHWITEFGWDDLAGPKVPSNRKAAYLPRGYMTVLASGTDKGFWFFDYSGEPEKAKQFFSGCGLLDHNQQPETAFSAMAGMTSILPAPQYIGSLRLEDGIIGHVFENRGLLVATLFTEQPETAAVSHTFDADAVYDWFGNALPSKTVSLSLNPTYAVGIKNDSRLYKQTAYGLESKGYVQASAGDTFDAIVRIKNNRAEHMTTSITVTVPDAWGVGAHPQSVSLAPGEELLVTIPVTLSKDQGIGEAQMLVHLNENGMEMKALPVRVFVVTPIFYDVSAIIGEPGDTELVVRLLNQSIAAVDAQIQVALPASWKTADPIITITGLASAAVKEIKIPITWSTDIKTGEQATINCVVDGFPVQSKSIIPNHLNLPKLSTVKIDGDISDLPASAELPQWMLGFRGLNRDARIFAAWQEEGLYLAVDVQNSKSYVTNPRTFWEGDVLELFLGTSGEKDMRAYREDDHQFWIIPLVKENKVYLGRWKRGDSIEKTRYDIQAIEGSAVKTKDGYVMEVLIKKDAMKNWAPKIGGRLGVMLSLTAVGTDGKREIYWPMSKQGGSADQPGLWGAWHLQE